jgi:glyoxylase-like metal-dependent hydrolase (beta-lactamase superfamily II)
MLSRPLGENAVMALLVENVVAPYYGTNCWILAGGIGQECIVIDPGIGNYEFVNQVKEVIKEKRLKVSGILITHGHVDHFFTLIPLQSDVGISKVLIHKSDRDLLTSPQLALTSETSALLPRLNKLIPNHKFEEPEGIAEIDSDAVLQLAGMSFRITNTPGHTPGSVIAIVEDQVLVSGDTLFAGSIGRTDLPRGSISKMEESLREKIMTLPGDLQLLPGHGPTSRLEIEFRMNPYLIAAAEGRLSNL